MMEVIYLGESFIKSKRSLMMEVTYDGGESFSRRKVGNTTIHKTLG